MVEAMKKSESEDESEQKVPIAEIRKWIKELKWEMTKRIDALITLKERVRALEEEMLALQRGDNTGFKHENDGGWFD
jgi:uncharacterized coiled-coil protein SlyX